jgi:hypothetical protein
LFPLLILINTDLRTWFWLAGVVILAGHYIDFFNMIMPGQLVTDGLLEFQKLLLFFSSLDYLFLLFLQHYKKSFVTKEILSLKSKHFHY